MKFTQLELGTALGTWKYQSGNTIKYFRVLPLESKFIINWGRVEAELYFYKNPNRTIIENSDECYKRILSKARAEYKLDKHLEQRYWTPKCYDEFNSIEDVLAYEKSEAGKRKPRTRSISLIEWMSGMDEYRENDEV